MTHLFARIVHHWRAKVSCRQHEPPRRAKPGLERLEDRCLLNVSYDGAPLIQHVEVVPIFYGPAWASPTGQDRIEMTETYLKNLTASPSPLIQFLSKYSVSSSTSGIIGGGSVAPADIVPTHDLGGHSIRSATESGTTVTIQTATDPRRQLVRLRVEGCDDGPGRYAHHGSEHHFLPSRRAACRGTHVSLDGASL